MCQADSTSSLAGVRVAGLGDRPAALLLAGGALGRDQPDEAHELLRGPKAREVVDLSSRDPQVASAPGQAPPPRSRSLARSDTGTARTRSGRPRSRHARPATTRSLVRLPRGRRAASARPAAHQRAAPRAAPMRHARPVQQIPSCSYLMVGALRMWLYRAHPGNPRTCAGADHSRQPTGRHHAHSASIPSSRPWWWRSGWRRSGGRCWRAR